MIDKLLNSLDLTLVVIIFTVFFAFIKWLDSRNQNLRNERYKNYMQLMKILAGSKTANGNSRCMTEQIAAAWLLFEYKEYYELTLKILDNRDLENMSAPEWKNFVAPQIKLLINEIKSKIC